MTFRSQATPNKKPWAEYTGLILMMALLGACVFADSTSGRADAKPITNCALCVKVTK